MIMLILYNLNLIEIIIKIFFSIFCVAITRMVFFYKFRANGSLFTMTKERKVYINVLGQVGSYVNIQTAGTCSYCFL
jgi:hypothetical protein